MLLIHAAHHVFVDRSSIFFNLLSVAGLLLRNRSKHHHHPWKLSDQFSAGKGGVWTKLWELKVHHSPSLVLADLRTRLINSELRTGARGSGTISSGLCSFSLHFGFVIWGHFFNQENASYWENNGFRILAAALDCTSLSRLQTGLSLMFNVIAAVLPIFSGNTLLALTSPIRKQLDKCHASGQYMDIGTHSFRNIRRSFIPWKQKIVWGLLALLALPFHVL